MRIRSVDDDEPSAVVKNTSLPGMSLEPGVPSTSVRIDDAFRKVEPSYP